MEKLRYRVWNIEAAGYEDPMDVIGISPDCKYIYFKELDEPDAIFVETIKGKYIIEQDTGLKDKNGEKIYEGDIVEYDWYIVGDKPAYRVKKRVVLNDLGARVGDDRIRYCTNVEVIGNIHEK